MGYIFRKGQLGRQYVISFQGKMEIKKEGDELLFVQELGELMRKWGVPNMNIQNRMTRIQEINPEPSFNIYDRAGRLRQIGHKLFKKV